MPRRVWVTGVHGEFDLVEVPAPDEHDLQDVVKRNPQLIPAEDLGLDGDLLVVGRETSLASGSVDLLCLARSGDLLVLQWYSNGASIRLRTPDRNEPLSIGWVFLEGAGWYRARHVTLGADEASLTQTPSVAQAVREYRRRVQSLPGAVPVGGKLDAYMLLPNDFPAVKDQVLQTLEELVTQVAGT